jgi:hypothetical protein
MVEIMRNMLACSICVWKTTFWFDFHKWWSFSSSNFGFKEVYFWRVGLGSDLARLPTLCTDICVLVLRAMVNCSLCLSDELAPSCGMPHDMKSPVELFDSFPQSLSHWDGPQYRIQRKNVIPTIDMKRVSLHGDLRLD